MLPSIPSYYPSPPTKYGPPGGSTAQVQRSGIPYFVSPFMSNYPGARTSCPTFPSQSFDNVMVVGPGFNLVPHKLVTAIASGLYFDLAALLSPLSDESSIPTLSFDGRLVITPPPEDQTDYRCHSMGPSVFHILPRSRYLVPPPCS